MGKRVLAVSPEFLVEFLKAHNSADRAFTVANPLPSDTRLVTVLPPQFEGDSVDVLLESTEWSEQEDPDYPPYLERPVVSVHLHPEAE